jgi:hypothetical protein
MRTSGSEILEALSKMGAVSGPCRGQRSRLTNAMVKAGVVSLRWISMREYALVRTPKGSALLLAAGTIGAQSEPQASEDSTS